MAIRFYTDEHVHPGIVKALRKNNIDVLTAQQAGMLDVGDNSHLQFATSQGRVHNVTLTPNLHIFEMITQGGVS